MSFSKEEILQYMEECFKYCEKAIEKGEVPVGCIFVHNKTKKILYGSHNLTNKTKNANAHCEINCIKYFETHLPYKIENKLSNNQIEYIEYNEIKDLLSNCHCLYLVSLVLCAHML